MKHRNAPAIFYTAFFLFSCTAASNHGDSATVEHKSFDSEILGKTIAFTVILPPNYRQRAQSGERFSVAYNLHCAGCSDRSALDNFYYGGGLDAHMEDADFIVASPYDGFGFSWWVNSPNRPEWRYEDCIVQEFKPLIDSLYATKKERGNTGICGHSMGGFGALHLIAKHPDIFGVCYAIKPGTEISDWSGWFGLDQVFGDFAANESTWLAFDINHNANRYRDLDIVIHFYTGIDDDWFYDENRRLHERFKSLGIEHGYAEKQEPHTPNPPESISEMVQFFDSVFAGDQAASSARKAARLRRQPVPALSLVQPRKSRAWQVLSGSFTVSGRLIPEQSTFGSFRISTGAGEGRNNE